MGRDFLNFCNALRQRVVRKNNNKLELLLANFSGMEQQKDIEKRTPLVEDFFRVKVNVKAFSSDAKERGEKERVDFSDNNAVFKALAEEFDMPYWALTSIGKGKLEDYNKVFIYQLQACNLYCPYCYVDDTNKSGMRDGNARFFSIPENIDIFQKEKKNQTLNMFRPSGGEPTLAVEQWLECPRELEKRGMSDVYVQGDTNLVTGHFIEELEDRSEIEKYLLEKVADFNRFGLLCSFKGTDVLNFAENTQRKKREGYDLELASELLEEQFYSFKKYVKAGIDAYPFLYNPNPASLESFLEILASKVSENVYLKTWVFLLKPYGPEKERLEAKGINPELYQKRLDENFRKSEEIMQDLIWKKYGMNYKANPRTGIKLKVKE